MTDFESLLNLLVDMLINLKTINKKLFILLVISISFNILLAWAVFWYGCCHKTFW